MGFFGSIGLPPILGAVVAFGETAGGVALVTGVLVRPAALLSLPILLGATAMPRGQRLALHSASDQKGALFGFMERTAFSFSAFCR